MLAEKQAFLPAGDLSANRAVGASVGTEARGRRLTALSPFMMPSERSYEQSELITERRSDKKLSPDQAEIAYIANREAKAILAAGITYAVAVAATKKLVEKSLRPALLGSLVNDDDVRAGYGATDDVRMQFLRAQYRRIGDRARSLAESDDEWREAMEGV